MPSTSPAQAKLMSAIAHGWHPAGASHLPPLAVAKEFHEADKKAGEYMHYKADGGKVSTVLDALHKLAPLHESLGTADAHEMAARKSWLAQKIAEWGGDIHNLVAPRTGQWGWHTTDFDHTGKAVPATDIDRAGWQDHVQENLDMHKAEGGKVGTLVNLGKGLMDRIEGAFHNPYTANPDQVRQDIARYWHMHQPPPGPPPASIAAPVVKEPSIDDLTAQLHDLASRNYAGGGKISGIESLLQKLAEITHEVIVGQKDPAIKGQAVHSLTEIPNEVARPQLRDVLEHHGLDPNIADKFQVISPPKLVDTAHELPDGLGGKDSYAVYHVKMAGPANAAQDLIDKTNMGMHPSTYDKPKPISSGHAQGGLVAMADGGPVRHRVRTLPRTDAPAGLKMDPLQLISHAADRVSAAVADDPHHMLARIAGGLTSQIAGLSPQGKAEFGRVPGIVDETKALPAGLTDLGTAAAQLGGMTGIPTLQDIQRGMAALQQKYGDLAPAWSRAAEARTDKLHDAVHKQMGLTPAHGFAENAAEAGGMMMGQIPIVGEEQKAASLLGKLAKSPMEWLSPSIRPKLSNYAVGTLAGGALGTAADPNVPTPQVADNSMPIEERFE